MLCALYVVLCCFFSRFLVTLCAVPFPQVLCGALECRAFWCGTLLCCPVLCALWCGFFAVVLWFVLLLLLSVVLLALCGVVLCVLLPLCIFISRRNCFLRTPAVPSASCPPCMQQNHTLKKQSALFSYFLDWQLPPPVFLSFSVVSLVAFVHLQRKGGGKRDGAGPQPGEKVHGE